MQVSSKGTANTVRRWTGELKEEPNNFPLYRGLCLLWPAVSAAGADYCSALLSSYCHTLRCRPGLHLSYCQLLVWRQANKRTEIEFRVSKVVHPFLQFQLSQGIIQKYRPVWKCQNKCNNIYNKRPGSVSLIILTWCLHDWNIMSDPWIFSVICGSPLQPRQIRPTCDSLSPPVVPYTNITSPQKITNPK